MNHFLANEWSKARAQKRGGGLPNLSLDWAAAEKRFDLEPADNSAPDKIFEKQWALTLLDEVLSRLECEYQSEGKTELFAALKQTLMGTRESQPYAELAASLGMNEGAVKVAVHRLRKALSRSDAGGNRRHPGRDEDVEDEMRHLFAVLAAKVIRAVSRRKACNLSLSITVVTQDDMDTKPFAQAAEAAGPQCARWAFARNA